MSLEEVFDTVESQLSDLGKRLCPEDAAVELREESEVLAEELRHAYEALSRCRRNLTEARRRIAANEIRATMATCEIETRLLKGDQTGAWQLALRLDEVRQKLTRDRTDLPYLENACRTQEAQAKQVERALEDLAGPLVPCS